MIRKPGWVRVSGRAGRSVTTSEAPGCSRSYTSRENCAGGCTRASRSSRAGNWPPGDGRPTAIQRRCGRSGAKGLGAWVKLSSATNTPAPSGFWGSRIWIADLDRGLADENAVAEDIHPAVGSADHDADRALRRLVWLPAKLTRQCRGGSRFAARVGIDRRGEARMGGFRRRRMGVGDDDMGAGVSDAVELPGKFQGQAHAAVRGGIAGELAGVQGDAVAAWGIFLGFCMGTFSGGKPRSAPRNRWRKPRSRGIGGKKSKSRGGIFPSTLSAGRRNQRGSPDSPKRRSGRSPNWN